MTQITHRAVGALGALVVTTAVTAGPIISGTPIHSEDDFFGAGPWAMTVTSYVYDSTTDLPDGFTLSDGEFLFAYLLQGDGATDVSVNSFSVGNPNDAAITSVGFSTDVVPIGLDPEDREDPYLYGYSGPSQATVFTYTGNLADPFSTLDPGEWSLVWYVAEATGWENGPATGSGAGLGDTQFVPVPVPAPGALAILSIAGLMFVRRRHR